MEVTVRLAIGHEYYLRPGNLKSEGYIVPETWDILSSNVSVSLRGCDYIVHEPCLFRYQPFLLITVGNANFNDDPKLV